MPILSPPTPTLHYNPFGGIEAHDIYRVLVPQFDLEEMMNHILNGKPKIIELVGKMGRGKTTHLKLLHQLSGGHPIFLLNNSKRFPEILQTDSAVVFIDSIHHLNILQRHQVFKTKQTIVLTAHRSRFWEYKLAEKSSTRISIKGIDKEVLKRIIQNRIQLATVDPSTQIEINDEDINQLIRKHGDDYRTILNHLYDQFQNQDNHGRILFR